jgi:DNA-binding NarL/FixJ family response regulator
MRASRPGPRCRYDDQGADRRRPGTRPRRLQDDSQTDPDIRVVAEADEGAEAVEAALRTRPDIALMDIRMPGMDGLEATRRIMAAPSPPRVLILTTFDLDEYVFDALTAGASGFLL